MRRQIEVRGPFALLAIGLACSWSTSAAFAACGMPAVSGGASGPPSISTTESSTTQVLEQIRRRTQEAQTQQPIPVSTTTAEEAAAEVQSSSSSSSSSASSSSSSSAASSGSAPSAKKSKPKPAASQSASSASSKKYENAPSSANDYAIAEQSAAYSGSSRTTAVWSQGFLGYDRHKNLAPGNQENPTRTAKTAGGFVGADWTQVTQSNGIQALQYGVFTGYSDTRAKNSDTTFSVNEGAGSAAPPPPQNGGGGVSYNRSNNKEDIDGPFVGAYMAYVHNAWTFDTTFKADFFDLDQSSDLRQVCGNVFGTQTGSASVNNYMIAANVSHRYELTERHWWEPTAGVRYTYTDFSKDTSNSVFETNDPQFAGTLGLDDGYAVRLQFGARLGQRVEDANGYIWTTTVGAFLYSDVIINGFNGVAGQTGQFVGPVDERELRGLAQLETRLNVGNGITYLLQAEVRGGEDVFGAAGQLGIRYEW